MCAGIHFFPETWRFRAMISIKEITAVCVVLCRSRKDSDRQSHESSSSLRLSWGVTQEGLHMGSF